MHGMQLLKGSKIPLIWRILRQVQLLFIQHTLSFYLLSHSVCAQYNKSLLSADSQLNVTVGGKLDALKRAVDLMDESTIKLDNFTQNMKKTDEKIEAVNTTISNFEYLKRVSHMC